MLTSIACLPTDTYQGLDDDVLAALQDWEVTPTSPSGEDGLTLLSKKVATVQDLKDSQTHLLDRLPLVPFLLHVPDQGTGGESYTHNLIGNDVVTEALKGLYGRPSQPPASPQRGTSSPDPGKLEEIDSEIDVEDENENDEHAAPAEPRSAGQSKGDADGTAESTNKRPSQQPAPFSELKRLWDALGEEQRTNLATLYVSGLVTNRSLRDRAQTHQAAPDVILLAALDEIDTEDAKALRLQVLRARAGLIEPDDQVLARSRVATENQLLSEIVAGMQKWRSLANWAPWFLLGTLIFTAAMGLIAIIALFNDKLDGYQLAVVLFTLAVCAVSPVAILLLQRPLAGIDKWTPDGAVKDEEAEKPADGKKDGTESAGGDKAGK